MKYKRWLLIPVLCIPLMAGECDDAQVASQNISKAADNFEVNRQIVFYNGITDKYIAEIEGRCSIKADGTDKQLEVTCKIGPNQFKKDFLGLSDNVTYFALQKELIDVSVYHYRTTFKPQAILTDWDFRGSAEELTTNHSEKNQ